MTGAAVVAYVLDCSLDIHDNHESGDAVYIEVTTYTSIVEWVRVSQRTMCEIAMF